MKRIMAFFLALVICIGYLPLNPIVSYANDDTNGSVKIDDAFPDEHFKNYVKQFDENGDGKLNQNELDSVHEIVLEAKSVSSLKGIEYFKNLTKLCCVKSPLTKLDVSHNPNLTELECYENQLTGLDVSHNPNLTYLECANNKLTRLDVSHNPNLTELDCQLNKLESLNLGDNAKLTTLECWDNNLESLDVSHNPNLTELKCDDNKLASLDVSHNKNLTKLECRWNKLASLDLSHNKNLTSLSCTGNGLESLDVRHNTNLTYLQCSNNKLTLLDVSHNPNLNVLLCNMNKLASLDVSHNPKLEVLDCRENPLTSLKLVRKEDATSSTYSRGLLLNTVSYTVKVEKGSKKIPFNKLFQGFDKTRIIDSEVQREDDGFTWDGVTNPIKFRYQLCENPIEVAGAEKAIANAEIMVREIEFDKEHVEKMVVIQQPTKQEYTDGENLDLAGLKVTLTDNQGLTQEVEFKDFKTYHITANPKNDTPLTVANNNKPVTLTTGKGKAETKALTVNPEIVGPIDPTQQAEQPADISKYWTVTFTSADITKGTVAAKNTVYVLKSQPKTLADITAPDTSAKPGYEFDKWDPALDAHTTIDKDMTIKAYFNPKVVGPIDPTQQAEQPADISKYWTVTFTSADTTKGTVAAKNTVYVLKSQTKTLADIQAPEKTAKPGYEFDKWDPALDAHTTIDKDMTIKAYFKASTTTPTPQNPPVVGPSETPAPTPEPKPQPKTPIPSPAPKPQSETPAPKQPETSAPKPQPEKRSGMIPQTGESASFAGLLAALGFSIAGLAIFRKKKMMKGNNK